MSELEKKIQQSIRLLKHLKDTEVELSYSGGKDSDVILALAKMAGINYRAIYKNTTIDPPGTIQHCKENGVEIIRPKQTFFELIRAKGYPTRYNRFCCSCLKEYKLMDISIQGMRRAESHKRALYKEPIICRTFGSKKNHVSVFLPLLEWTNDNIRDFINYHGIKCHPLYYNEYGKFCVDKRLGCMGCPLASDNGMSGFKKYPKLVKLWIKNGQFFLDTHPNCKAHIYVNDAFEMFASKIFYDSYQNFTLARNGMFGRANYKEMLEDFFGVDL